MYLESTARFGVLWQWRAQRIWSLLYVTVCNFIDILKEDARCIGSYIFPLIHIEHSFWSGSKTSKSIPDRKGFFFFFILTLYKNIFGFALFLPKWHNTIHFNFIKFVHRFLQALWLYGNSIVHRQQYCNYLHHDGCISDTNNIYVSYPM